MFFTLENASICCLRIPAWFLNLKIFFQLNIVGFTRLSDNCRVQLLYGLSTNVNDRFTFPYLECWCLYFNYLRGCFKLICEGFLVKTQIYTPHAKVHISLHL